MKDFIKTNDGSSSMEKVKVTQEVVLQYQPQISELHCLPTHRKEIVEVQFKGLCNLHAAKQSLSHQTWKIATY